MTTDDLFAQVCHVVPPFAVVLDEHLKDNDELLPHVVMGDLRRYIASTFTGDKLVAADPPSEQQVRVILSILDAAMTSGIEATENVVAVSLLEYLWLEPYYADIEPLLGANLRAEIASQRAWEAEQSSSSGRTKKTRR